VQSGKSTLPCQIPAKKVFRAEFAAKSNSYNCTDWMICVDF